VASNEGLFRQERYVRRDDLTRDPARSCSRTRPASMRSPSLRRQDAGVGKRWPDRHPVGRGRPLGRSAPRSPATRIGSAASPSAPTGRASPREAPTAGGTWPRSRPAPGCLAPSAPSPAVGRSPRRVAAGSREPRREGAKMSTAEADGRRSTEEARRRAEA